MIKIYTSNGCFGCREAIRFFKKNNLTYEEKDFTKIPLTKKELRDILFMTENGFDDILSVRSKQYNRLKLKLDDYSINDIIGLIIKTPQILSRPIMIEYKHLEPHRLLIGYNNSDIEIFLNSDTQRVMKRVEHCGAQLICGQNCEQKESQPS